MEIQDQSKSIPTELRKGFIVWIRRWKEILLLLIFLLVAVAYLFRFMSGGLQPDEHHYVSAGVLVKHYTLYRDIPYFQTPYLPFIYQAFFTVTGTGEYLFKARLLTFGFLLSAVSSLFLVLRILSKDVLLSVGLVFLFCVANVLYSSCGWADNNIPAMALFLGGTLYLLRSMEGKRRRLNAAISGILLMIAVGIKLFYAVFLFPSAGLLLFGGRSKRVFGIWLAGIALGVLPAICLLIVWPNEVIFGNWTYHQLTAQWLVDHGHSVMVAWKTAAHSLKRSFLFNISNASLLVLAMLGIAAICRRISGQGAILLAWAVGLVGMAIVVLLRMRPLYIQHMTLLLVMLGMVPATVWGFFSANSQKMFKGLLVTLCLISFYQWSGRALLPFVTMAPWTGLQVAGEARELRGSLKGSRGRVATLAPIYALEAGLDVYLPLATGPFLYRLMDKDTRDIFWQKDQPDVIITGFEDDLDRSFNEYALRMDYRKLTDVRSDAVIYVRK